jgi:hypothetical protein
MNARADDDRDSVAQLRVPPHAVEAEQAVLGALIADKTALQVVADVLSPADFFRREHLVIYAAIRAIAARNEPVDVVTLFEELDGEPLDYGGLQYLNALASSMTSAANVRRYAELVRDRALLRRLIAAADEAATAAFTGKAGSAPQIIETALARMREVANEAPGNSTLPLLDCAQLEQQAASVQWLVKGVVQLDAVGVLFGTSGTFKSYLAIDLALHVAHGLKWLGRRTHQGPVVIIAAEGKSGISGRIRAWHRVRGLRTPPAGMLRVVPVPVDLVADAWRVVEAVQAAGVVPALVVIDTLSQTFAGRDEDRASEVSLYLRELNLRFRAPWQCSVLVVHHSGHSQTERPRGSSTIQANTSFVLGCFRDEKQLLCTLTSVHSKEGGPFDDAAFSLRPVDLGHDEHGDAVTQLAAWHLSSSSDVQDALDGERKAGRTSKTQTLLSLAQNGMREAELRKLFYDECPELEEEARRKAYFRARKWAITHGTFDVAAGVIVMLKSGTQ